MMFLESLLDVMMIMPFFTGTGVFLDDWIVFICSKEAMFKISLESIVFDGIKHSFKD